MAALQQDCLRAHELELWRGDRCLFRALNLSVSTGELLHVTGANGSGKTSLLRVLTGLSIPESGRVTWNEQPVSRQRDEYHRNMGYVAHYDGIYDDLSLVQNVHWGAGLHQNLTLSYVSNYLDSIGLSQAADVPGYALSAGQKRRVSLARVHLSAKRLWILDEPLANLDAQARGWCDQLIAAHIEQGGCVIATSHQPLCEGRVTSRVLDLGQ